MNIYPILSSKPHNAHYLNRYIKFIELCAYKNKSLSDSIYTETHHIVPKAKDMFPEYENLSKNPWNKISLTYRQHFIAHWILWKTYRNLSTAYAFRGMASGRSNEHQKRYKSKYYELAKQATKNIISKSKKGLASYKDSKENIIQCFASDPKVLSGEYVSTSLGRKYSWKTTDRSKSKNSIIEAKWKQHPIRKISLYFLDIKIVLEYTKDNFTFIPYLDQGWQLNQTKEYRSKIAKQVNLNMSRNSRKKAGLSISKTKQKKKSEGYIVPKRDIETRKKMRKYINYVLFYNTITDKFETLDEYDKKDCHIKCFVKSGIRVWNLMGKRYTLSSKVPRIPDGYYTKDQFKLITVLNQNSMLLEVKCVKDKIDSDVIVYTPNGDRLKFFNETTQKWIYLSKEFINKYGIPKNVSSKKKLLCRN